jgi:hypothetical protein
MAMETSGRAGRKDLILSLLTFFAGGLVFHPSLIAAFMLIWSTGQLSPVHLGKPKNGEELIAQMRDKYYGKWYRTVTFTQKTTLPDGKIETWYEALELPGKLRIDIAPLDSMNTILFRSDSVYQYAGGKLKDSRSLVHPLMVLGFDVYDAPVAQTVQKLRGLGFDLAKLHQTRWQGHRTYVVGAEPGDTTSPQFWIDAERLYFVRSLEPSRKDSTVINDTRFQKYIPISGGWLEMEVLFLANGKQKGREEYSSPRANVDLNTGIFDPGVWKAPGWVK